MVMVFVQFEPIWVNVDSRSGQGQVKMSNFENLNFIKQRHDSDAECHQKSNGAVCFMHVGQNSKKPRLMSLF